MNLQMRQYMNKIFNTVSFSFVFNYQVSCCKVIHYQNSCKILTKYPSSPLYPHTLVPVYPRFKPQSNLQTLFGKHLKFCLSSKMFVGLATTQTRTRQTSFCLCQAKNVFEMTSKMCLSSYVCRGGQTGKHV